jgi:proteic killer suppression protein
MRDDKCTASDASRLASLAPQHEGGGWHGASKPHHAFARHAFVGAATLALMVRCEPLGPAFGRPKDRLREPRTTRADCGGRRGVSGRRVWFSLILFDRRPDSCDPSSAVRQSRTAPSPTGGRRLTRDACLYTAQACDLELSTSRPQAALRSRRRAWRQAGSTETHSPRPCHSGRGGAILDGAGKIQDVDRLPGMRLHRLKGDLAAFWSVSISGNWRVIFRFESGDAMDVDLVDYH